MAPHLTRNTAVMRLEKVVLVLPNAFKITNECFHSVKSFFCREIANGRTFKDSSGRKVMEIKFYNAAEIKRRTPHLQIQVNLPPSWTPRMYLAILHHTIRIQHAIVVHKQGVVSDLNGIDQLSDLEMETILNTLLPEGILYLL